MENHLAPDERVAYTAGLSCWPLVPQLLFLCAIAIVCYGVATEVFWDFNKRIAVAVFLGYGLPLLAATLLLFFWRIFSTELAITDRRIMYKTGLFHRRILEMRLDNLENVDMKQGIFGRMANYGNLVFSGIEETQITVDGLAAPLEFKLHLQEMAEQAHKTPASSLSPPAPGADA